jgi:hypothetical protein
MAGYSARQASYTTGDTITAAHSNDEFNQSVEGSGFAVALQIDDQNSADSFSVKGFQLEFTTGGRR